MLKSLIAITLTASGLLAASVMHSVAADAKGDWVRPNGVSKIRISACGKALCGKLIWLKSPRNDTQNPDVSKRTRPLVGVQIVQSMKPTGQDNQWKGKVYNAEDGKTYTGFIELTSSNRLTIRGKPP